MRATISILATGALLVACQAMDRQGGAKASAGPASAEHASQALRQEADVAAASIAGAPSPVEASGGPTGGFILPGNRSDILDLTRAMIIRTGQATVEVAALDKAIADLQAVALRAGGFVANTQFSGGRDRQRFASLEIRMPAERFDEAVSGLRGIGTLEALTVSAEEVGEEFTDITARVTNARRMEQRLIELLATRTGKLADILVVEGELARVREQVERYEGRLRFLQSRASTSRITVSVHEPLGVVAGPPGPITLAVREAWENFVKLVALAIGLSGVVIPVAALAGGAWWALRARRVPRLAAGPD